MFALGFANAQLMLAIGRYGMRAYQATDIKSSIQFSTYLVSRLITCLLMLIISMIYIIWSGYSLTKGAIIFSICIIKMVDALEDVFHGLFQQNGRIDIAGQFLTIRNLITMTSFVSILMVTDNLLIACIATGIISIISCILLNLPTAKRMVSFKLQISKRELGILFISCLPLFIGSFLSLYIYNVPKYMIDRYLTADIQTYYSILFMPAFVINLFSEFIFKPLLTGLAIKWEQNQIKEFLRYICQLLLGILFITVVVVGAGHLIGRELLSFVYGVDLMKYRFELILLLCGGGFGACVYFLYNVLTAMRQQVSLLLGYMVVAVIITFISPSLVRNYNMMGATIACFFSSILLFIILSLMLLNGIIRKRTKIN
jgi:O-antigen/teichoic acid export membrane protein